MEGVADQDSSGEFNPPANPMEDLDSDNCGTMCLSSLPSVRAVQGPATTYDRAS